MAEIYNKDVIGYMDGNKLFCADCIDESEISLNNVFVETDRNKEKAYFCDECGKQL